MIETPILLTGTLSVFRVANALLSYLLARDPSATSLNPVVGETNDGFLSDIRRRPITEQHVVDALTSASTTLPAEGCVGAGTGTAALGFKAGIGTSSRTLQGADYPGGSAEFDDTTGTGGGTVGALVQANFSGVLTVLGVPIPAEEAVGTPTGNSCMIVVATDLPLDARQLGRLARRAIFALGRVGSDFAPGSGDYAIALSTARATAPGREPSGDRQGNHREPIADSLLSTAFQAVMESVEEALLNSLTMAHTVTGFQGNTRRAVSHDAILSRLTAAGVLR